MRYVLPDCAASDAAVTTLIKNAAMRIALLSA
jgi:hypothetical protein